MAFRLSQCSSVAVPHVSQCDLWVTEVWEQKELEVTYPKSHGCSQPRGGTGSGAAPPKYVLSTSVPWEETEQQPSSACAGPARPSPPASVPRAAEPGFQVLGWPQPVSCVSCSRPGWRRWKAGSQPAASSAGRAGYTTPSRPRPSTTARRPGRGTVSARPCPRAGAASLGLLILDASLSADPRASVMRACGSPTHGLWLHGGPFKMVLVASSGPPARLL